MTTPDHPDWNTPQAIAAYLAGGTPTTPPGGVPLITKSGTLFSMGASQNVAAGTTFTVGGSPFALTQIGYEAFIQVSANAGSVFPFGRLKLTWSDTVSGLTTWVDTFSVHGGNAAFEQYYLTGITKGNQVTVTFSCDDAAHALQFQMTMLQNSRVYVRDDLRQLTNQLVPALTLGNYDQSAGILLQVTASVPASTTTPFLIAQFAGKVEILASSGAPYTAVLNAYDGAISAALPTSIWSASVTAVGGGPVSINTGLPRTTCVLALTNPATVGQAFSASVIADEYPP